LKKSVILFAIFLLAAACCFAQGPSGPDPVEGYWLSVDEKTGKVTAGWHIYAEGGKVFGMLLSTVEHPKGVLASKCKDSYPGFPVAGKVNQMTVAGTPWIFGLSQDKPGEWSGGHVVNPEDGGMFKCKLTYRTADGKKFKADVLEMRGELGIFGRSQFWQKTDEATASSLGPG